MKTEEFDFDVPSELIALYPNIPRDNSKLVEVSKTYSIHHFQNLINLLNNGDCLVINNTKVIPAKLKGYISKKKIYITLNKIIEKSPKVRWSVFIKPLKKIKENSIIKFSDNFSAKVTFIQRRNNKVIIEFNCPNKKFNNLIDKLGNLALPHYIEKNRDFEDKDFYNYQTIFAKKRGAVAAPTASLHFSDDLLKKLILKGIKIVPVTLHINGGTFLPIKSENINDHEMHYEQCEITKKSAEIINTVRNQGKKCIAVGTTVLRLLETAKDRNGKISEYKGETNIFIKPGWKVNSIDGLITNFHTPKSTLFILISSIIGKLEAKKLYKYAIEKKLRFFSYGDACLIWN